MPTVPKEMVEEVLENLMAVLEEKDKATVQEIAKRIGISPQELEPVLGSIQELGLVRLTEGSVVPTKKGKKLGKKMVRKHRLLESFLHDVLGIKKDKVHEEACKLEHALSDEAEDALCRFLDNPNQCPDDNRPIPPCEHGKDACEECGMGDGRLIPLTALKAGNSAKVRFIRGGRTAVRRLRDMGILPDMQVTLRRMSPFGGPIELEVCGTKLALGRKIAEKVFVEAC